MDLVERKFKLIPSTNMRLIELALNRDVSEERILADALSLYSKLELMRKEAISQGKKLRILVDLGDVNPSELVAQWWEEDERQS